MTNASDWRKIQRLDEYATKLGFKLSHSKRDYELFALLPADDNLPFFSRDAEMLSGDADQIWAFLYGWEKSRVYLVMSKSVTEKKIQKVEQDYRHEQLVAKLRGPTVAVDDEDEIPF